MLFSLLSPQQFSSTCVFPEQFPSTCVFNLCLQLVFDIEILRLESFFPQQTFTVIVNWAQLCIEREGRLLSFLLYRLYHSFAIYHSLTIYHSFTIYHRCTII